MSTVEEKEQSTKKISKENIIGIVLIVVFLPIIIINMIIVIKGIVKPTEFPMVFGRAPVIVESDSMTIDRKARTGAFNRGDLIFIKKVDASTLEVGDIITYYDDAGEIISHKIVKKFNDDGTRITKNGNLAYETQGTFNSPAIIPVEENKIIGLYTGRIPKMGKIAMFLQEPYGVLLLLAVPLGIILLLDFLKKKKQDQGAQEKIAELEAQLAAQKEGAIQQAEEKSDLEIEVIENDNSNKE